MGHAWAHLGVGRRLVVSTVLAFACAPAVAHADLSWSGSPVQLSPAGTTSSDVHLATDAAGDAIAVWLQVDSGVARVAEASRPAGGNFQTGSIHYISGATAPDTPPSDPGAATAPAPAISVNVAMNASGAAIITWTQSPQCGCDFYTYYAMAPPGGSFGTPQLLVSDSVVETVPALDDAGDAIVAYPEGQAVSAVYRPAGASTSFGSAQQVGGVTDPPYTVEQVTDPSLAIDGAGDAVLAWHEMEFGGSPNLIRAAYRPAGASTPGFGAPATLSDPAADAERPTAAVDASGNALVAFDSSNGTRTVETAVRPKAQGSFNGATAVSSTTVSSASPTVAFGPSGDAFLAWAQHNGASADVIEEAYAPAGQGFGTPQQISATGTETSTVRLGVDGQDRPAAEWTATDSSGNDIAQAASRVAGQGPFSTPQNLSLAGDFNETDTGVELDTGAPALSVSPSGQAVAAWQMTDPSTASQIIYDAIGTPPGAPRPPPPPPPPPPIPNAITPDTSLQVGKPGVLTVKVTGDVQRVQWQIGDVGVDNITPTGDGSQDSIRFTPTQRNFTVSVTAFGQSGSTTYSRGFTIAKASTDPDDVAVRRALSGTPPVYGVGDATTLLGKNACGAVTVYTSKQQVSGCMRPINVLADIPDRERGAIQTMARSLGLDPSDPQLMNAALQRVDGYVGVGPTTLDGKWPAVPSSGASMISFPGLGDLTSSNASLNIGGLKFGGLPGGFSLNVDPGKVDIPLGSLPKPSLPDIGGFPLIGNWNIDLGSSDATIDTHLQLPSWLTIGGIPLQIPITLHATPSGLVLDKLNIGPLDVNVGPLSVKKFHISYDRASDTWTGSGQVCLLTGVCLDMSPPNGEVKIVHNTLNYMGATLVFPEGSGVPLFAGVDLTKIGFGLGLDPTRIVGRGAISVLDLVELDGTLVVGFPTTGHPFVLARDEVGPDFPAQDYGPPFTEPTIGASADVFVNLPDVGNVKLGSGYLLYEIPDYIALGGAADFTIPDVLELGGAISGAANFSDHTLNLNAEVHACLLLVGKVCANAVVDVSKAPNDGGGAGGCVGVGPVHIGGGILWKGKKIVVWPFDGCKWSRFKVDVRPSLASAASASRTIQVVKGKPNPAVKLYGDGAAPLVRVTGPGGQQLDSTDSGLDYTPDGHIRILRYQGASEDFTVVGLENAQPGRYTVTTLPGSVPFTEIDSATDPPNAKASGKVTADGPHRTLRYAIRDRPDQTVTFWDVERGGAATKIAKVSGGGKGEIHFNPAPGTHIRTIVAQFALDGMPAERVTVAHYKPPAPELPTPRGLHLTRRKQQMLVSWRPSAGAARYDVVVTDRRTGYQRLITTERDSVVVKHLPLTVGGAVTVRATAEYRQSLTTRARFKRLAAPKSAFSKLGHCKVRKHAIKCTGGPPVKHHRAKHRHHGAKHKPTHRRKRHRS